MHKYRVAKWLDISCAKRREIIPDGLAAASVRQIFASETSSHLATRYLLAHRE